jgi:hypothetical protein
MYRTVCRLYPIQYFRVRSVPYLTGTSSLYSKMVYLTPNVELQTNVVLLKLLTLYVVCCFTYSHTNLQVVCSRYRNDGLTVTLPQVDYSFVLWPLIL